MKIAERLRYYRTKANKSQKEIELETGIPQTTLSEWERDNSEPRVSDLQKLAVAFGVSISELLDGNQSA